MNISSHYEKYREMLIALHKFIAQGNGDSSAADDLRDKMDQVWVKLSSGEITLIRYLSSDLYGVNLEAKDLNSGQEFKRVLEETKFRPQSDTEWHKLHKALIGCEGLFPPNLVYYYKSRMWNGLGDPVAGLFFTKKSIELDPDNMNVRYLYLSQLWNTLPTEALNEANTIAGNRDARALLLFKAADIIFSNAELNQDTPNSVYEKVLGVYKNAFRNIVEFHEKQIPASVPYGAMVFMGLCWKRIGNHSEAEKSLSDAIQEALILKRDSSVALIARGILNYGVKTDNAVTDFNEAIKKKASLVWPYFFMAHWALNNNEFAPCVRYCDMADKWPADREVKAELIQWRAISSFNIDANLNALRSNLSRAHELAPNNPIIETNLNWAKQIGETKSQITWSVPNLQQISDFAENHWTPDVSVPEMDAAFA